MGQRSYLASAFLKQDRSWRSAVGGMAAIYLCSMHLVHAQSATEGGQLEEVIVTAERREESLQQIPISITAVSGETLAESGKTTLEDALLTVPAVRMQEGLTQNYVFIRGIGPALNTDPDVSINLDGVYMTNAFAGSTFDIARVEVLRGPQGTLYGRNATAGSVNVITNDPVQKFEVAGSLQTGNYEAVKVEGVLNAPLSDSVAVRVAYQSNRHEGYLSNGTNDEDTEGVRLKALITPTDNLKILLAGDYITYGGLGDGAVLAPFSSHEDPWDSSGRANDLAGRMDSRKYGAYARVDLDMGFGVLTYQPAYYEFDNKADNNVVGTPFEYFSEYKNSQQQTHELRLASSADSRVSWIAGLYYYDYKYVPDPFSPALAARQTPAPEAPTTTTPRRVVTSAHDQSMAAFAQLTYPFTEKLRGTVGLRYTEDKKTKIGTAFTYAGITEENPRPTQDPSLPPKEFDKDDGEITGKVALEYDVTDTSMLYVQASKGYKSGGINDLQKTLSDTGEYRDVGSFEPQTIWAYEIGSKNRFLDDLLQINASLYYYDFRDQQVYFTVPNPPDVNPTVAVQNAAAAEIYGAELETQWVITRQDRLSLSVAYNSSTFKEYCNGVSVAIPAGTPTCTTSGGLIGIDRDGEREPNAPEWTGALGYQHVFELSGGATLTAAADIRYYSDYDTSYEPAQILSSVQEAYHQSDARLVYAEPDGKWTLFMFVNNIEDEPVALQGLKTGTNPAVLRIGAPRTYGVGISTRF